MKILGNIIGIGIVIVSLLLLAALAKMALGVLVG